MAQKLCDKYFNLTPIERVSLVGELVHAIQSDDSLFDMAQDVIKLGILKGVFLNTSILPDQQNDNHE
jgi:uncharacterized protein YdeI (BOF family)